MICDNYQHPDRYLVFYCPMDLVFSCATLLPLKLVLSGMKEVTRTWKVLSGVTQAHSKYKDSLLVMIAIGWARGLILFKEISFTLSLVC